MTAAPLLAVENLSVAFGGHPAVSGLSFTVKRGETVALVGESGSGKSATALAIMGLVGRDGGRVTAGRILLDGTPPLDLAALPEPALRRLRGRRIAQVFQEPMTALNPVIPLGEQVAEALRLHEGMGRAAARAAARAAFARVGIPDPDRRLDQFPHELSGGLRQRVMIAMALACRPDLLIADEPTTALDVTTQAGILDLLRRLQAETGMGILFITHDMGVVAEIAQRMVVLRAGRKQEEGPVAQVFARPRADYTRMLMAAAPRLGAGSPPAPRDPAPVLGVEDLSVGFPTGPFWARRVHHAVAGVSLTIGRGETLGLVGESGCGKSTVARAILRLIEPSAGRVRLMGRDLAGLSAAALRPLRAEAQIVFQDPFASLNPRLTVRDLVTEPAAIHGRLPPGGRRALAAELLARVGLEPEAADRWPHQFSGGQRQRLCIARALSVRPALIIADEPVSALDVSVARQVTDLFARLQREDGMAILFISHDVAVVERVSHRIAVMQAGRIVETGPTEAVLAAPRHPYTQRLLAAVPRPEPGRLRPALPEAPPPPPVVLRAGARPARAPLVAVGPGHLAAIDAVPPPVRAARLPAAAEA